MPGSLFQAAKSGDGVNFNINVGQLIQGAITAVVNAVAVLIAGRYVAQAVERIEKKALNGKTNCDKPKEGKNI